MVKLQKEPKNLELAIKVAKNGQFRVFPRQAANSAANGEFRGAAKKIRVPRNTAGHGHQ